MDLTEVWLKLNRNLLIFTIFKKNRLGQLVEEILYYEILYLIIIFNKDTFNRPISNRLFVWPTRASGSWWKNELKGPCIKINAVWRPGINHFWITYVFIVWLSSEISKDHFNRMILIYDFPIFNNLNNKRNPLSYTLIDCYASHTV